VFQVGESNHGPRYSIHDRLGSRCNETLAVSSARMGGIALPARRPCRSAGLLDNLARNPLLASGLRVFVLGRGRLVCEVPSSFSRVKLPGRPPRRRQWASPGGGKPSFSVIRKFAYSQGGVPKTRKKHGGRFCHKMLHPLLVLSSNSSLISLKIHFAHSECFGKTFFWETLCRNNAKQSDSPSSRFERLFRFF